MEMFPTPVGSLMSLTLIVYQEFPISCLIPSVTHEVIVAISSFCTSGLVCVAFRGIVLMIARKPGFFDSVIKHT